ncbi:MAG TPA: maltose alpha-D-glucosyltransferase [Thermomicrobiales bacterium]|nr:maltose alpha-D-glucosyltransferase [Thermomicrobiales bacterium]
MAVATERRKRSRQSAGNGFLSDDPIWYKDALIYQTHIRAFMDSNGDGIGDFRGLTQKLDYLQDLGVTTVWVLPFYPSPLKDDGYDIADYTDVNPSYGTLKDVRQFVREAHKRGLRVITELVCNHTSDQHPWFQRARRARPGSAARNFYVWSDTAEEYSDARIIFKDFEQSNWSWDPVAGAYYWHRFYAHQPDLNFDNSRVHEALFKVLDLWMGMGIDGLRLDAIPYLYEREGTNCENLPETHAFLKAFRARVDERFPNRMILAEANQWPEDAVQYFGDGDECHMAFHFPVMPRLYMAVRMEDRYPIIDILEQTPPIPDNTQWAMFLRNHDELTLEMVTDEERDYMYRAYAQDPAARINLGIRRRLAPLMANNRRRIELMNGLLFSLPGTPIIYYGDEIGMGDNIFLGDRNGVRTPMQWSGDRNAGFSTANGQRLYLPVITDPEYHYTTVNVETQQRNPQSLLWWMKRLIALRKRYQAFGRGTIQFLHPENRKVLTFIRQHEDETILVVANLSRFVQGVQLDLSQYVGRVPVEMFGRTDFPPIGELPYFVTLGPHSFYWFALEPSRVTGDRVSGDLEAAALPELRVAGEWTTVLEGRDRASLLSLLPSYLYDRRWFGGKARRVTGVRINDIVPMGFGDATASITILDVDYSSGDPDSYVLPLAFATGERAETILTYQQHAVVARLNAAGEEGILYDAMWEPSFCQALLEIIARRRRLRGANGSVAGATTRAMREVDTQEGRLEAHHVRSEQSNSSVIFGDQLILKLFRRLDKGTNPDLEIGRFLTEKTTFPQIAAVTGSLEYEVTGGDRLTVGVLQKYVTNEGDAWQYALDVIDQFFERMLALRREGDDLPLTVSRLFDLAFADTPDEAQRDIGVFLDEARILGQRTAEMHVALGSDARDPAFAPEPFSMLYQRSMYQSFRGLTSNVVSNLRRQSPGLPDDIQEDAEQVLELHREMQERFRAIVDRRVSGMRIRHHGDYHLGQVLYTGRDFTIIDFEGEPARPITERRIKRSPLRDVAGMLRSFHYAAIAALFDQHARGLITPDDAAGYRWARYWHRWVSAAFLRSYLDTAGASKLLPASREEQELMLGIYLLDKAVYELEYELNNRPAWVRIPLRGILDLMSAPGS